MSLGDVERAGGYNAGSRTMVIAETLLQANRMTNEANRKLTRQWRTLAAIAALSLIIGWSSLGAFWGRGYALRWMLIASALSLYQLGYLHRNLASNHLLDSDDLLPTFGAGTTLTLARGMLIAWTAGFIFSPRPPDLLAWIPMVLYTVALILDGLDGYAARVANHETLLGERLDNELDSLGLLVAITLAVWYQALPGWFFPVGLASYAFRLGIRIREHAAKPVHPLSESQSRRPIAGFTMGFSSAMLWPIASPPETTIAGALFLLPFTFSFTRDWLVVSGSLDPTGPNYQRVRTRVSRILFRWSPLVMRFTLLLVLVRMLIDGFVGWSSSELLALSSFETLLLSIGLLAIVVGAAGRFSAFILLFPIAFAIIDHGMSTDLLALLVLDLAVLLLGTGAFSLWEPERRIFGRRWGTKDG